VGVVCVVVVVGAVCVVVAGEEVEELLGSGEETGAVDGSLFDGAPQRPHV
jgi:hypothetical protein